MARCIATRLLENLYVRARRIAHLCAASDVKPETNEEDQQVRTMNITLVAAVIAIAQLYATAHASTPVRAVTVEAQKLSSDVGARVEIEPPYLSPRWDRGVAPQYTGLGFPQALAILLPPDLPGLSMQMEPGLEDLQLQWDTGLTRKQALLSALPPDVRIKIADGKIQAWKIKPIASAAPSVAIAPQAAKTPASVPLTIAAPAVPASTPKAEQPKASSYIVLTTDKNLRKVVTRWAGANGWVFEDAYWSLDRDIPVMATASFQGDFRQAVLGLMKTTEITDMPAKPCFYTNMVVRIVAMVEKCDKTKE